MIGAAGFMAGPKAQAETEFTLYWKDGKTSFVKGDTIEQAFSAAGYGAGAVRALDFYLPGRHEDNYVWDSHLKTWRLHLK